MTAEFRSIQTRMWREDEWFQELDTDARLLFIYLFTNPSASISGIYRLPLRTMAFESGLGVERIKQLLDMFAESGKVYFADGVVWVVRMRENQLPGKISEQVRIRLDKDVSSIPDCDIKRRYLTRYGYPIDTLSIPFTTVTVTETDTVTDTVTEPPAQPARSFARAFTNEEVKQVAKYLEDNGIPLTPFVVDSYMDAVKDYGIQATVAGIQAAAENGKQQKMRYVLACIRNVATGSNGNGNGKAPLAALAGVQLPPELAAMMGA